MPRVSGLPENLNLTVDDWLVTVDRRETRNVTAKSPIQGVVDLTISEIGDASASGSGFLSVEFWNDLTNATHLSTPLTLVKRDSNGRFQSATPSISADVTNKLYVDAAIQALDDKTLRIFKQTVTGAVTSFYINHNFGTRDVMVQVYDLTTYDNIWVDILRTTTNQVRIDFTSAPGDSLYRVLVQG